MVPPDENTSLFDQLASVSSAIDSVVCGSEMLIVVSGELDFALHDELRVALANAAQLDLTIDLADVSFVDVASITLFDRAAADRSTAGHRTVIVSCPPPARRLFRLARAQHLLSP